MYYVTDDDIFLKFKTVFLPVGEGLFTVLTARAVSKNNDHRFNFIYDCGSRNRQSLVSEINNLPFSRADILFLSHLHEDHVNGLKELLDRVEVDIAMLPYVSPIERILLAITASEAAPAWYYDFLRDPIRYLLEELNVRRILLFLGPGEEYPGEGPGLPPEDRFFEDTGPPRKDFLDLSGLKKPPDNMLKAVLEEEPAFRKYVRERKLVFKAAYGSATIISHQTCRVRAYRDILIIVPYVRPVPHQLLQRFRWCLASILPSLSPQKMLKRLRDPVFRRKARSCYSRLAPGGDINYTSLATYISPVFSEHVCSCFSVVNLDTKWLSSCPSLCHHQRYRSSANCRCSNDMCRRRLCGSMLTSDLPLSNNLVTSEFNNYYCNFLRRILVYQVPHHGSINGFNRNLNVRAPLGVVSYGINNGFGHPNPNALRGYRAKLGEILCSNERAQVSVQVVAVSSCP